MKLQVMISALLLSATGNVFADWFDFFDVGDFFGKNRHEESHQAYGNSQGQGAGASKSDGRSRGRGEADINLDFDLGFKAKGWGSADTKNNAQSRGNVTRSQALRNQYNAWGSGYNQFNSYTFPDASSLYGYTFPDPKAINAATAYRNPHPYSSYTYAYPSYSYGYTPYMQQGYQAYSYPMYYPYYMQQTYGAFSPVPAIGAGR